MRCNTHGFPSVPHPRYSAMRRDMNGGSSADYAFIAWTDLVGSFAPWVPLRLLSVFVHLWCPVCWDRSHGRRVVLTRANYHSRIRRSPISLRLTSCDSSHFVCCKRTSPTITSDFQRGYGESFWLAQFPLRKRCLWASRTIVLSPPLQFA